MSAQVQSSGLWLAHADSVCRHTWTNVSPDNGEAKLIVFAQQVEAPVVDGEKLEQVW